MFHTAVGAAGDARDEVTKVTTTTSFNSGLVTAAIQQAAASGMTIQISETQDGKTALTLTPVGVEASKPSTGRTAVRKVTRRGLVKDKNRVTRDRRPNELTGRQLEINDYIKANPGEDIDQITEGSGVPRGTVQTYLPVLLRAMLVRMDENFRYHPVIKPVKQRGMAKRVKKRSM